MMATAANLPEPIDFSQLMPQVAQRLLGEPNERMSKGSRLRFGTHGSMEIDTDGGWFCDHEAGGDARGGVLALIQHKEGCDRAGALRWLEEEGLKGKTAAIAERSVAKKFYDYRGEDGAILYRVERHGAGTSKSFRQHGPDGRGGFHSQRDCMLGLTRVPYRLPELLAADPATIVYVCEGEKDVDRLAREGLVATTNPGGAGKFTADLAVYLAGRRVVALEDNDEPGAAHVAGVLKVLAGVAAQAVALKLPDLPPKGDVSDWLDFKGGIGSNSAFDLARLAENALSAPKSGDLIALDDVADWEGLAVPPRRWFVKDWLPIGEAALLTGAGSIGKSLVAQQLAATGSAGRAFLGVDTTPMRTLYITCEDGREEAQRRHKDIATMLRVSITRGQCLVKSWKGELDLELVTFDAERRLRPTPRFNQLRATVLQLGVRFLVLDNTSHLFGGDENVKREVAAFVNLLNGLAAEMDGVVLLLGHPNKTGLNNPDAGGANQFGGSVAWENQVRSRMFMSGVKDDADARELTNPKANYSAKGSKITFRWHQGAFVRDDDLPEDVRGEYAAVARANAHNQAFLACLRERAKQGDGRAVGPSVGPNYAPAQFEGNPLAKGMDRKQLKAAMDRLISIKAIETHTYRNNSKGRDVTILREALGGGSPNPELPPRTPPEHYPQTTPNLSPELPSPHTTPLKGERGAASGATAPVEKQGDGRYGSKTSRVILAPGETGDDVEL